MGKIIPWRTGLLRRRESFAIFAGNHHNDGRIAVWRPAPQGFRPMLIEAEPDKFFKPPHAGARGWIGMRLNSIRDEELASYPRQAQAWMMIAPKKLRGISHPQSHAKRR